MNRAAIVRVPTFGLTAAAAAMAGSAAHGAEWTFVPSAQVTSEAQNNPRLDPDGSKTESSVAARASFQLQRQTETFGLNADTSIGTQRYQRDSGLDRNDQHLDLGFHWQSGENLTWTGAAAGARDTTLTSELGVTGQTQGNERHDSFNFSLGPTWQASERMSLTSALGWEVISYPDHSSELQGYRYGTANVSANYALSDRAVVSLSTAAGHFITEESINDSRNASVQLQGSYVLSTLWRVSGGAGPSWVRVYHRSTRGVVFDFSLARQMELSSVALSVSRSQSPSGLGLMTNMDDVSLNYARQLGERVSAGLSVGVVRRRDSLPAFGIDLQEVRYRHVDATVAWTLSQGWQVVIGADNRVQRIAALFSKSRSAQNYEGRLTLSWTGNPHVY